MPHNSLEAVKQPLRCHRTPSPSISTASSTTLSTESAVLSSTTAEQLQYSRRKYFSKPRIHFEKDLVRWIAACFMFCCFVIVSLLLFLLEGIPSRNYYSKSPQKIFFDKSLTEASKTSSYVSLWLDRVGPSVIPVSCHSHNDYWRPYPLFSALSAGCTGIEADVWLSDDGTDLLVGHKRSALSTDRTLKSLYIDPILDILEQRNSENTTVDGIYAAQPEKPVILLIDVKEKPATVWPIVLQQLATLRERSFLTSYETANTSSGVVDGQKMRPAPLVVVGSGLLDTTSIAASYNGSRYWDFHDTFLDTPLDKLPDPNTISTSTPQLQYDGATSYYASVSFKKAIGSVMTGFSSAQLATLRQQVDYATRSGLVPRYWDTPAWPIGYRDYVWDVLVCEGVGMLNVDDVRAGAQYSWTTDYKRVAACMIAGSVFVIVAALVFGAIGLRILIRVPARRKENRIEL